MDHGLRGAGNTSSRDLGVVKKVIYTSLKRGSRPQALNWVLLERSTHIIGRMGTCILNSHQFSYSLKSLKKTT